MSTFSPNAAGAICPCCMESLSNVEVLSKGFFSRCRGCSSILYFPQVISHDAAWTEPHNDRRYYEALEFRRQIQSRDLLAAVPVAEQHSWLDYGCGQGAFVKFARSHHRNIVGVDLFPPHESEFISSLPEPWGVPEGNWDTIFLLDVAEHHPEPSEFLPKLNAEFLVLKLPYRFGPFSVLASVLCRLGIRQPMERLLLTADFSPHCWIPSKRGIERLASRCGRRVVSVKAMPDFGSELPDRLRLPRTWIGRIVRAPLSMLGSVLERLGSKWSDSVVVMLERA